tara:strand:+ start:93 stop:518 length:426 start_codon:yes stop_codon:yes gene_type:complete
MTIRAVKAIIILNKRYLLQLRDKKKNISFPNHWGLFGGRVDKKEINTNALVREIKEETNLKIKIKRKILDVNFNVLGLKKKRNLEYFECKIVGKKNILLSEGKKYNFFSFKQIKRLNIVPMDFVALKSHFLYNNSFISIYR